MLLMSTRQSLRPIVVVEGEEVVEEEEVGLAVAVAEGDEVVLVTAVAEAEVTISSYYRRGRCGKGRANASDERRIMSSPLSCRNCSTCSTFHCGR